jgi:hypothetical protein
VHSVFNFNIFVHISALLDPSSSSSSSANSACSKKNADTSGKKGKGSNQSKRKAPDELLDVKMRLTFISSNIPRKIPLLVIHHLTFSVFSGKNKDISLNF